MQPIINIAVSAIRDASNVVVRALDRLENPQLDPTRRQQIVERVAATATEIITDAIHTAYPEHKFLNLEPDAGSY